MLDTLFAPPPPPPPPVAPRPVETLPLVGLDRFSHQDIPRRLCPSCQTPLPAELDTREAHLLAVVGLNAAGKTYYLAAALSEATRSPVMGGRGILEFSALEETAVRLHQEYYVPMFRDRTTLKFTSPDRGVARKPLTFRVQVGDDTPTLVMTHDVSGEILTDLHRRADFAPFVHRASAMIFVLDPTEFETVRAALPPELRPPERNMNQVDLLTACLRELSSRPGGSLPPVAVTIAKSDLLARVVQGQFRFTVPATEQNWTEDIRKTSDEIRDLLQKIGEYRLVEEADQYGMCTFHAVSALGSPLSPTARAMPQPLRCLDPLTTVLVRLSTVVV